MNPLDTAALLLVGVMVVILSVIWLWYRGSKLRYERMKTYAQQQSQGPHSENSILMDEIRKNRRIIRHFFTDPQTVRTWIQMDQKDGGCYYLVWNPERRQLRRQSNMPE